MEDPFVPRISLYRLQNATFELRVHLHLPHTAHAAHLAAADIELTPHGDQLLVSGSVTPHVEGYYHSYPYSGEAVPQGTLVWTDQPCGRFGRSVDLGLAPGTEYVILDRRVDCGDYVMRYILRNKPSLPVNQCVNVAAGAAGCLPHHYDPAAHYSSFHHAHHYGHPLYAERNIVPCSSYPGTTQGVDGTHLPGVGVGGGCAYAAGVRFMNGAGVGFNAQTSAGQTHQETTTVTEQGQDGTTTFTLAGTATATGAGVGVGVSAGAVVAGGAGVRETVEVVGETGMTTTQVTQMGTGQMTALVGTSQTGQVAIEQTTLAGTSQTQISQVATGPTGLVGTGQATFVGAGESTSTLVGTEQTTEVVTGQTTATTTQVTSEVAQVTTGQNSGTFVGTGTVVGTLAGTGQTTQTTQTTETSIAEVATGQTTSSTQITGGSALVGTGAVVGTLVGTGQTTQTTETSIAEVTGQTTSTTEVTTGTINTHVGTSQTTQTTSTSAEVDVGVSVSAGTTSGVTITEESSSSGQYVSGGGGVSVCGGASIGGGISIGGVSVSGGVGVVGSGGWAVEQTRGPGQAKAVEGTIICGGDEVQRGRVVVDETTLVGSREQGAVQLSTQQTTGLSTQEVTESMTQQVTQTSISSEVDVTTGRGSKSAGAHVTLAETSSSSGGYSSGLVSTQQDQVAWQSSTQSTQGVIGQATSVGQTILGTEQTAVQSSTQQITESSTQQVTQTSSSSELDLGVRKGSKSAGAHVTFADSSSSGQYSNTISEQTGVQSSLQTTQTTQASSELDVEFGSVSTATRVTFAEESSGAGRLSGETQVEGQGAASGILVLRGTEDVQRESSVEVVERDSERVVSDVRTSMEGDIRTSTQGATQSSTQLSTVSSNQQSASTSLTQVSTTESSVTTRTDASLTQQITGSSSQVEVGQSRGSEEIIQGGCSGTYDMRVGEVVGVGLVQETSQSSTQQVTLGSAQEYYQGSTQEVSQSSTQQATHYESEVDQYSSQNTSLGGQLASAALRVVGQYASGTESKSVGGMIGDVVVTLAEGAIASHGGTVRSAQEDVSSSVEVVQTTTAAAQEGHSSSIEIVQSATESTQENVLSSTEVVQTAAQESVSSSAELVQTAAQESISSSTEVAQTATQQSSTRLGSSTANIAIFETDQYGGAQSSTGIVVSSTEPNVSTSRVQGLLQGKNVEAAYDSVMATSSDVQAGSLTTSTSTTTLVAGEDHGVSFASAGVGERVDTSVVNELEGGVQTVNQTSISTEVTRVEATGSTSTTAQELLTHQSEQITTEVTSGEALMRVQGHGNYNGSDHDGSSVHSDNWHLVSRTSSTTMVPTLKTFESAGQVQTEVSEQIQAVSSSEQTQTVSSEQFQAASSSEQTRTVTSEEFHTSSERTYTSSSGETRAVHSQQDVPVSAELIHSISAQYTVGNV